MSLLLFRLFRSENSVSGITETGNDISCDRKKLRYILLLFPLHRSRRFGSNIVNYTVYRFYLVCYAA